MIWGNSQVVPEDAKREDSDGKRIAAIATVTAKELGDDLIVVFYALSDITLKLSNKRRRKLHMAYTR